MFETPAGTGGKHHPVSPFAVLPRRMPAIDGDGWPSTPPADHAPPAPAPADLHVSTVPSGSPFADVSGIEFVVHRSWLSSGDDRATPDQTDEEATPITMERLVRAPDDQSAVGAWSMHALATSTGDRRTNQDAGCVLTALVGGEPRLVAVVTDGHGPAGGRVANGVAVDACVEIRRAAESGDASMARGIRDAVTLASRRVRRNGAAVDSGCTLVAVAPDPARGPGALVVAGVGDSHVLVLDLVGEDDSGASVGVRVVRVLTTPHDASNPDEVERVGPGSFVGDRLRGATQFTRAIGDADADGEPTIAGLTEDPDVAELHAGDIGGRFLALCTDGIHIPRVFPFEVGRVATGTGGAVDPRAVARLLVDGSPDIRDTDDNATVVVVDVGAVAA